MGIGSRVMTGGLPLGRAQGTAPPAAPAPGTARPAAPAAARASVGTAATGAPAGAVPGGPAIVTQPAQRRFGRALLSWRVAILPFLGQELLYREFRLDEAWDS